jgi:hypothetical protein
MSWSLSINPHDSIEETRSAIEHTEPSSPLPEESLEQLRAAKVAVADLLDSGCVGGPPVLISFSGHANPGHRPAEGWANDYVSITITQSGSIRVTP